ncbi:hypothetical protein PN36_07350 [Candidatus Thiomargarita nelsonii]|uniref:Endonuclease GajA/Old nuclease/RecF-like AAA domain-containing protein n=1 Tax=Candidatus Thiomargarita nelsonii TaxID=1003181 RepID=A0A0A6PES3_9GAMM|nr:hypothetical protein PN36_07350 [Candidatus Thiomargarita nelsonii]
MRIDSLEVQNFRCFEHKKLNFSPQFNVLIGNNGRGKTAILDTLAVGMGALLLGFDGIGTRSIREEEVRHVYRQSGLFKTRCSSFFDLTLLLESKALALD